MFGVGILFVSSICLDIVLGQTLFLASQDALEVMRVTHSLTHSLTHLLSHLLSVSIDFTDVTLVSDVTYRRLYWCDPDDPEEHDDPEWLKVYFPKVYFAKVYFQKKLSSDESYLDIEVN